MPTAEHLDPALIQAPPHQRFRVQAAFTDRVFVALKASIAHAGGNVQAIKVSRSTGTTATPAGALQRVFGGLRHQACLELGLPVLAVVEDDLPAQRALVELEASNAEVSLFERGSLYGSALDAGLLPSTRRLADTLGRPLSEVAAAVAAARLPAEQLDCLRDPRCLTPGIAKRLVSWVAADPEGALRRARQVRAVGTRDDRQALRALLEVVPGGRT